MHLHKIYGSKAGLKGHHVLHRPPILNVTESCVFPPLNINSVIFCPTSTLCSQIVLAFVSPGTVSRTTEIKHLVDAATY